MKKISSVENNKYALWGVWGYECCHSIWVGRESLRGKVVVLQIHEGWKRVNYVDIRRRRVSGKEKSKCSGICVCLTSSRNSMETSMAGAE